MKLTSRASCPLLSAAMTLAVASLVTCSTSSVGARASILEGREELLLNANNEGNSKSISSLSFGFKSNNYYDDLSPFFYAPSTDDHHVVDAPKYYHLNAMLYKVQGASTRDQQATDLRPLNGARANPSQSGSRSKEEKEEEYDGNSTIDSLIKAMRREQAAGGGGSHMTYGSDSTNDSMGRKTVNMVGVADVTDDDVDEASIQRKSTDILDGSSRLRSRGGEPRRKRRAIVKHSPPKLRSRRISKLSSRTRTKLRMKPKRRA